MEPLLTAAPWIPHQLVCFTHQYFLSLTILATTPSNIRNLTEDANIDRFPLKIYRESEFLFQRLTDQLRSCVACYNLGPLASPPSSFFLFFPSYQYKKRDPITDTTNKSKPPPANADSAQRGQLCQLIYSGKGKMQFPLQKLTIKPCIHYMEGKCNKEGCTYKHCLFPRDFDKADRLVLTQWVESDVDVTWSNTTSKVIETMKASGKF